MKLAPVSSINQLKSKAKKDKRYVNLTILAANSMVDYESIGFDESIKVLERLAKYDDASSIVEEVNSYINDLGGTPTEN